MAPRRQSSDFGAGSNTSAAGASSSPRHTNRNDQVGATSASGTGRLTRLKSTTTTVLADSQSGAEIQKTETEEEETLRDADQAIASSVRRRSVRLVEVQSVKEEAQVVSAPKKLPQQSKPSAKAIGKRKRQEKVAQSEEEESDEEEGSDEEEEEDVQSSEEEFEPPVKTSRGGKKNVTASVTKKAQQKKKLPPAKSVSAGKKRKATPTKKNKNDDDSSGSEFLPSSQESEAEEESSEEEEASATESEDEKVAKGRNGKQKQKVAAKAKSKAKASPNKKGNGNKGSSSGRGGNRGAGNTPKGRGRGRVSRGEGGGDDGGDEVEEETKEKPQFRFIVEYAKSSRATCRRCEIAIPKDEVRVGCVIDHPEYGLTTYWHHLSCRSLAIPRTVKQQHAEMKKKQQQDAERGDMDVDEEEEGGKKKKKGAAKGAPKEKKKKGLEEAGLAMKSTNVMVQWCRENIQGFTLLNAEDQERVAEGSTSVESETELEAVSKEGTDMFMDTDYLVKRDLVETREAPPQLVMPLLQYQKESLAWMCHQEESEFRGGILADEMGMGKTIQAICLILARLEEEKKRQREREEKDRKGRQQTKGKGKASSSAKTTETDPLLKREMEREMEREGKVSTHATLVICPVVALVQWRSEIERFTEPGTLRVLIYHGPKREEDILSLQNLAKSYDVILTTYSILEVDYRKIIEPTKVDCEYCGKRFLPDRYAIHLRYFCGPDAHKTEAQSKQLKKKGGIKSSKHKTFRSKTAPETKKKTMTKQGQQTKKKMPAKGKGKTQPKKKKFDDEDEESDSEAEASESESEEEEYDESSDEESSEDEVRVSKKGMAPKKGKAAASSMGKKKEFPAAKGGKKPLPPVKGKGKAAASSSASGPRLFYSRSQSTASSSKTGNKFIDDSSDDSSSEDDRKRGGKKGGGAKKRNASKNAPRSVLHQMHWSRIILDEAHYIKERRCNTAKSVFALTSDYKWCLTGTPLQNRVGELYSLIRFLRMDPYAYYFCRHCDCKSIEYKFGKEWRACEECGHSPIHHFSYFNRKVVNPIKTFGYIGEGRHAMMLLKEHVLDQVLLRRTKEGRADDIILPPKVVRIRRDHLDEREDDFYQAIYTQSRAQFDTYVQSGTVLNNYAHIFDLLIRLRQAVDHPYLVIHSNTKYDGDRIGTLFQREPEAGAAPTEEKSRQASAIEAVAAEEEDEITCGLCHEQAEDPVQSQHCSHWFCRSCVLDLVSSLESGAASLCPVCEKPLTVDLQQQQQEATEKEADMSESKKGRESLSRSAAIPQQMPKKYARHNFISRLSDPVHTFQTSTKIEALVHELKKMEARDIAAKAIVFSQFVNMLDLIEFRLQAANIKSVKLSGHMGVEQRSKVLTAFREDASVKVFLISLKAGGVALNLTVANNIFLMDPWWNPAAEMQAIDRTHRIGQFKPIYGTRFIIADTIEERILRLQEKKQLIFDGTVGKSQAALNKLTEEDLRFLFS